MGGSGTMSEVWLDDLDIAMHAEVRRDKVLRSAPEQVRAIAKEYIAFGGDPNALIESVMEA